jgi:hypothetical protein
VSKKARRNHIILGVEKTVIQFLVDVYDGEPATSCLYGAAPQRLALHRSDGIVNRAQPLAQTINWLCVWQHARSLS